MGIAPWVVLIAAATLTVACAGEYRLSVTVTSVLPLPRVPIEAEVDFSALLAQASIPGHVDLNTLEVRNLVTRAAEPHALSEAFQHGDRGTVSWVARDPGHRRFEVRFQVTPARQPLRPPEHVPAIGTGDLLRYNAGEARPIALIYPTGLLDLTGDGKLDLVGCWNYAYRPGEPWDGVVCFPGVGQSGAMEFGEFTRVRYVESAAPDTPQVFSRVYMACDFADLNGDGRLDMACAAANDEQVHLFLNSGEREPGGLPVFVAAGAVPCPKISWGTPTCRVADLDGDGVPDLIVGRTYLRNTNPKGWPFAPAAPVTLDCGEGACFYDVDGDGRLDAVSPAPLVGDEMLPRGLVWRRGLDGNPLAFGPPQPLTGVDCDMPGYVSAVVNASQRGLLVAHDVYQAVSFFEQLPDRDGLPRFRRHGQARSRSAVMSLSDQAWPCLCDWDGDGDLDLLVGGGYGWPRIAINHGTRERPAFAPAQPILAEGQPIRLTRDEVLGGKHWHNMGYLYPAYVDWDGDGLPDLMLPNETNRVFWYKNIGTRRQPRFGPRQQILCDGFPDGPEQRRESARLASDAANPNAPYPFETNQPFYWRTGAAFGDFNGDGLMDLVTLDGATGQLALFAQYRDEHGALRLRREGRLKLADGRLIDDSLTGRQNHWTQSFRCVDWDGDGLMDIVWSLAGVWSGSSIWLLRNYGTRTQPVFEPPVQMQCFGEPIRITAHGPHPWVGDFDGDGMPDLIACVEWSVYPFYSHTALTMEQRPTVRLGRARRANG